MNMYQVFLTKAFPFIEEVKSISDLPSFFLPPFLLSLFFSILLLLLLIHYLFILSGPIKVSEASPSLIGVLPHIHLL